MQISNGTREKNKISFVLEHVVVDDDNDADHVVDKFQLWKFLLAGCKLFCQSCAKNNSSCVQA